MSIVDTQHQDLLAHLDYRAACAVAERYDAEIIEYETFDELHDVARAAGFELPIFSLPDAEMIRGCPRRPGESQITYARRLYAPMGSLEWCQRADGKIFAEHRRRGWKGGVPLANDGKHHQKGAPVGRCYIRGWRQRNGVYVQQGVPPAQVGTAPGPHAWTQCDYATTTRLQRRTRVVASVPDTSPEPPPMPDPLFIPATRTNITAREIYEALRRVWPSVIGGEPGHEALLVLVAQSGIETGDWSACWNWNLGNVKRVASQPWTMLRGVWEIINGRRETFEPPHPQTHFRAFRTLDEGASAYLEILSQRFAKSWSAVLAGEPERFAHALKEQRYYTADENAYARAMRARYNAASRMIVGPGATPDLMTRSGVADALGRLGYAIATDGLDGSVRAFQKHARLAVDGIVGPKTRAALSAALTAES